jgi:hypothetical protein
VEGVGNVVDLGPVLDGQERGLYDVSGAVGEDVSTEEAAVSFVGHEFDLNPSVSWSTIALGTTSSGRIEVIGEQPAPRASASVKPTAAMVGVVKVTRGIVVRSMLLPVPRRACSAAMLPDRAAT